MKVRIKFSKDGEMRFIGHLDLQRFFQKAIRRSGLDIRYTEGLSPHMVMSFASPLGVGLTSCGEYFDIELNTPVSSAEAVKRLNALMPEGLEILDFRQVGEGKASKAMSIVAAADYEIRFRPGHEPSACWEELTQSFLAAENIPVLKENKKAAKKAEKRASRRRPARDDNGSEDHTEADFSVMTDIRPMIYRLKVTREENGAPCFFLRCAAGSSANLKPELMMSAFLERADIPCDPFAFLVRRLDLYALGEDGDAAAGQPEFISLNDLGTSVSEADVIGSLGS